MMTLEKIAEKLKGKKILITGGSGFFGKSFCETLATYGIDIYVMARNPVMKNGVSFIPHDVTKPFDFNVKVDYIIHAATPAIDIDKKDFEKTLDIIVNGTKNALDYAEKINCKKFLLVSSGAVYGEQPSEMDKIPESYVNKDSFFDFKSAYGTGKRISELLALDWNHRTGKNVTIARCFAFAGRHLPINQHFAIGNFVRDALANKVINVKGDGTSVRSYLDADDLVLWLLAILLHGESGEAYNVGSDVEISIKDLANIVALQVPGTKIIVQNKAELSGKRSKYVPSIEKVKTDLQLSVNVDLNKSIKKMIEFNRGAK
jgi:dTDP-glucose 4,6-dehydratase